MFSDVFKAKGKTILFETVAILITNQGALSLTCFFYYQYSLYIKRKKEYNKVALPMKNNEKIAASINNDNNCEKVKKEKMQR